MEAFDRISAAVRRTRQILFRLPDYLAKFYIHLNLRTKFALLIGSIVFLLILSLSIVVLQAQRMVLQERIEELCQLSVQNLTSVAKDNLLIQNYAPIQDVINNMKHLKIRGLAQAFVLDRDGKIIAHTDPSHINQTDSLYLAFLANRSGVSRIVAGGYTDYIQTILIRPAQGDEQVPIGLSVVRFSNTIVQQAMARARDILLAIMAVFLILSFLAVRLLSGKLSQNIRELVEGARAVADGNLDVQVQVRSRDEIGLLAAEFNKMVRSLKENLQMRKFVSPLAVDMIQSQVRQGESRREMRKEAIAVLFSDIRGFTSLSERLEPEELLEVVNVYLAVQARHIEANQGIIDKFAGDLVMAIFQGEDAPDHAVDAAVQIQKAVREINAQRRREQLECLTVGIGVNYGVAMLGSMGATNRMDYTAVGDVVNLASKLCNVAHAGHIIVTKNVIRHLKGPFSIIKMEPVRISGRKNPVPIYRIVY